MHRTPEILGRIASSSDTIDTIVTPPLRLVALAASFALFSCNGILGVHDLPVAGDSGAAIDAPADVAGDVASDVVDACAETNDDPRNCGACGHDCLGGGCVSGVCQPIAISTLHVDPRSIAVDPEPSGGVYVANWSPGEIHRVEKDGSAETQLYWAATGFSLTAVRVDEGRAYWVATRDGAPLGEDVLFQANKIDGKNRVTLGTWAWAWDVGVDATDVFLMNRTGSDVVVRVPIGLSGPTTLVAGPSPRRNALVVTPTGRLYFSGDDGVWSMQKDGTDLQQHVRGMIVTALAVDATRVWFASADTLWWFDRDAPCDAPLCPNRFLRGQVDASAIDLAVDDAALYWTYPAGCAVLRTAKAQTGIPVVDALADVADAHGIALDAQAVYFTSPGNVWKVAK